MSNNPQPSYPPTGQPQPGYPQVAIRLSGHASGCGGCLVKILILLGVVFALILALCCGAFYYGKSAFFTDQPAQAQKISDEIASPPRAGAVGARGRAAASRCHLTGTLIAEGILLFRQGTYERSHPRIVWRGVGPELQG